MVPPHGFQTVFRTRCSGTGWKVVDPQSTAAHSAVSPIGDFIGTWSAGSAGCHAVWFSFSRVGVTLSLVDLALKIRRCEK